MKTLKEHARLAWEVRDACNASGVARAMVRWFDDCGTLGITDTDARNRHPITVLYVDKLAHLAGCQAPHARIGAAYLEVHALVGEAT